MSKKFKPGDVVVDRTTKQIFKVEFYTKYRNDYVVTHIPSGRTNCLSLLFCILATQAERIIYE